MSCKPFFFQKALCFEKRPRFCALASDFCRSIVSPFLPQSRWKSPLVSSFLSSGRESGEGLPSHSMPESPGKIRQRGHLTVPSWVLVEELGWGRETWGWGKGLFCVLPSPGLDVKTAVVSRVSCLTGLRRAPAFLLGCLCRFDPKSGIVSCLHFLHAVMSPIVLLICGTEECGWRRRGEHGPR